MSNKEKKIRRPKWLVPETEEQRKTRLRLAYEEPKPSNGNGGSEGIGKRSRKKKPADDGMIRRSFFENDNKIFEQIHDGEKSLFIYYDIVTGEVGEVPAAGKVLPVSLVENELNTVGLAQNVFNFYNRYNSENEAEADLLTEVEGFIYRYVDLDDSFRMFAACYVLLSWLYDKFYSIPYLRLQGDFGTGKSRALDVVGGICYRPVNVSGATSAAGIFRVIDRWRGTLILDESDFRFSDETVDIIRILNQGFEKNRTVLRVNTNTMNLEHFQAFSPKIIASRKKFADEALESRCLSTITKQTNRTDVPFSLGRQFFAERDQLRKKLLMYRLKNWSRIDPEIFNIDVKVEPRLKQITLPFFVLFAKNRELLGEFKKFIEGFQTELIEDRAGTPTGQVVGMLFELFSNSGHKLVEVLSETNVTNVTCVTPGQIAEKLDYKPRTVGTILKGVGLKTRVVKVEGHSRRCVEYSEERFNALRSRYIPADGYSGYDSYSTYGRKEQATEEPASKLQNEMVF